MRREKGYAEKDPDWGMYGSKLKWLLFPRVWNPLFLMAIVFVPILDGAMFFINGFTNSVIEIRAFFHQYKVW